MPDNKINNTLKKRIIKTYIQAIVDIRGYKQTEIFINDFFTTSEVESFAKRLAVAYWLKKGRSYNNIKDNLNVSTATIASVQENMKKPGYKLLLDRVEAEEWATIWVKKIKNFTKLTK